MIPIKDATFISTTRGMLGGSRQYQVSHKIRRIIKFVITMLDSVYHRNKPPAYENTHYINISTSNNCIIWGRDNSSTEIFFPPYFSRTTNSRWLSSWWFLNWFARIQDSLQTSDNRSKHAITELIHEREWWILRNRDGTTQLLSGLALDGFTQRQDKCPGSCMFCILGRYELHADEIIVPSLQDRFVHQRICICCSESSSPKRYFFFTSPKIARFYHCCAHFLVAAVEWISEAYRSCSDLKGLLGSLGAVRNAAYIQDASFRSQWSARSFRFGKTQATCS